MGYLLIKIDKVLALVDVEGLNFALEAHSGFKEGHLWAIKLEPDIATSVHRLYLLMVCLILEVLVPLIQNECTSMTL